MHIVNRKLREQLHGHKSVVLWLTGLSGAGKSTIASKLEEYLFRKNISTYLLDGDNVRYGLCQDLSFSELDRQENMRRVGEVIKLMIDAGLLVIAAFISPLIVNRQLIKKIVGMSSFLEIYVDTPLKVCEKRDPKGLYHKAKLGLISNFTGINAIYEKPLSPDIYINGSLSLTQIVQIIICELENRNILQ